MKDWEAHLQYNWWKYLAVILVPVILWCWVFSAVAQPKGHERLHVLFIGDELDGLQLQRDLEEVLPTLTEQKIKQVKVVSDFIPSNYYGTKMTTNTYEFDLIIVSQRFMRENTGQFFRVLPNGGSLPGFGELGIHKETPPDVGSELAFGIVLWEQGMENRFGSYYSGSEKCYIFLSPQSENLAPLYNDCSEGNDAATQALKFLLGK